MANGVLVLGGSVLSIYQILGTSGTVTTNSFAPRVDLTLPAGLDALTVADVDADGKLDIALLNRNSSQVMILKNIFTSGLLTTSASPWRHVALTGATLVGSDALSGVTTVKYRIQTGSTWGSWITYSTPISISDENTHTIEFYATEQPN